MNSICTELHPGFFLIPLAYISNKRLWEANRRNCESKNLLLPLPNIPQILNHQLVVLHKEYPHMMQMFGHRMMLTNILELLFRKLFPRVLIIFTLSRWHLNLLESSTKHLIVVYHSNDICIRFFFALYIKSSELLNTFLNIITEDKGFIILPQKETFLRHEYFTFILSHNEYKSWDKFWFSRIV